ncbi:MAG: c-type cytochrome biogenesis protein CcmI [Planktomarina sp.]
MTLFIILAVVMTVIVGLGALALAPALKSETRLQDADVYKDQLRSLDKDRARGVVTAEEFEALRAEMARRLIAASGTAAGKGTGPSRLATGAAIGVAAVIAAVVYPFYGAPQVDNLPLTARIEASKEAMANLPAQAELDLPYIGAVDENIDDDYRNIMKELRVILQQRPDDLRGFELLARGESRLGNFKAAYEAQEKVIDLKEGAATSEDWGLFAELMIISAQDIISKEAAGALQNALRLNPEAALPRYRLGQLHMQIDRPDLALSTWVSLYNDSDPSAPYMPAIEAFTPELAMLAGRHNFELDVKRGPTLEDIEAAEGMTAQERSGMIEGMVAQLSERLATEGGPASEWAKLIRSLGIIGQFDRAALIYGEAQSRFAGRDADMALLNAAAAEAGIAP